MTAQTEARASLWAPATADQSVSGWTYDFDQIERISRAAYNSTGYDATMEVVQFVMAEADRRYTTALAAALQAERDAAAPKLPDDLAGLVRLLKALATDHECDDEMDAASTCDQAATAIQSLVARNAELEMGLEDLLSWFPDKPSEPEWRINAGNYGADAAVSIARSLLNKDRQP